MTDPKRPPLPEAHADELLAAMPMGIMYTDLGNTVRYLNPALARLLAPEAGLVHGLGQHAHDLLGRLTGQGAGDFPVLAEAAPGQANLTPPIEFETTDGRILACSIHTAHDGELRALGRMWLFQDVTHVAQDKRQLLHLADHDALTGLVNRRRLMEELARALSAAQRNGQRVALLIFDLDRFKDINDHYGHSAGDALLVRMANLVSGQIRRNELMARLGGDEFAILVPDATEAEVAALAERVVQAVSGLRLSFKGHRRRQTCSVGAAIFPDHAGSLEALLECADAAMYRAKENGRNHWCLWRAQGPASRGETLSLDWRARIDDALEHDHLLLHFQGVYASGTGQLAHLSALVRLRDGGDPARFMLPGSFLSAAERHGRMLDLDRWVLRQGIATLRRHPALPGLALKLSASSLADTGCASFILAILEAEGVAPARLVVELEEDAALADLYQSQHLVNTLRRAGCHVCLTDFGTGFASFAGLRHLDADLLRLNHAALRHLSSDRHNQACVRAMVGLAHALGRITLAGGVEDPSSHRALMALGVDLLQGHNFDRASASHPALAAASVQV